MLNCARLLEIYPPFSLNLTSLRHQQLLSLADTYGYCIKSKFNAFKSFATRWSNNREQKCTDEVAQKLWDDNMSCLAESVNDLDISDESVSVECIPRSEVETIIFSAPISKKKLSTASSPLKRHSKLI